MTPKKIVNPATGRAQWEIRGEVGTGGKRRQMRRVFATEKEAKAEIARIKHEQNQGVYVHPDKTLTVKMLAERWHEAKAPSRKKSTRQHYLDALRPLVDAHGDLPVVDLTDRHLMKLRDGMLSGELRRIGTPGQPMAPNSVNAMLGAVCGLLGYGMTLRVLSHNVAAKELVGRVRKNDTEEDEKRSGWGDAELRKFRISVEGHHLYGCWMLTAQGLRRGEVLGLQWGDIDWQTGVVTIRRNRTSVAGEEVVDTPKSKDSKRKLAMGASVIEALQIQRASQRFDTGWVATDPGGRRIRAEWYSDEFARLGKAAGLPPIVLHGARHAVATTMAADGIPLADIAYWLGQSQASLAVTLGYIHGSDRSGDRIRGALGD